MIERLRRWADGRGFRVGWGPLEVVAASRADVATRGRPAALDVYGWDSSTSGSEDDLRARGFRNILVVIVPRPAHAVGFQLGDERLEAVLPPTYHRYQSLFEEVRQDLGERGLPGVRLETLRAPLKQVASRLGLVRYGWNNLTYAPGLGSYIQLLGYVTDASLPLPEGWIASEPALLQRCLTCSACRLSCPAGAIGADRVLLQAERCLTFANENPGAWPDWIDPKAHHCLLGCLLCQSRCPENPRLPVVDVGVTFSAEETGRLLLDAEQPAGDGLLAKLARLGQPGIELVIGRNLRALLANRRS